MAYHSDFITTNVSLSVGTPPLGAQRGGDGCLWVHNMKDGGIESRSDASRRLQWREWSAVIASAGVIFYLSALPGQRVALPLLTFFGADKIAHVVLYGGFAFACY